jgi:hypothetical protein
MMKAVIVNANEWVYPDIKDYKSASGSIAVNVPRDGYACAQIVAFDTVPGDRISVEFVGDLVFKQPQVYRLLDVCVERNTGNPELSGWEAMTVDNGTDTSDYTTRLAPFNVFDIMQPLEQGGNIVEKSTTALYISWKIPSDVKPGAYKGKTTVTIGNESIVFPTDFNVHKAVLPKKSRLSITNWYSSENIGRYYGLKKCSDEWFEMFKKFMALMRHTHQTHIIINLDTIKVTDTGDGKYEFDFSNIERVIRMALEAGFEVLELGHLAVRNYNVDDEKYWLFYRPNGRKTYVDSPEGYRFLASFLQCWVKFLKENGWYDISVQHVGDEPGEKMSNDFRIICGIVRKFMPGMKLFDAVCHPSLAGSVDIWVPKNNDYQHEREKFEDFRELGDEIWFYTCCFPTGKFLNRMLDMELLRPRLLHWGNYFYNLKGYLHWGFNYFQGDTEFLRGHSCGICSDGIHYWGPGDTHFCYPGNENGPWPSVRSERMRAGAEDCELLYILSDKDKKEADVICQSVVRSFDDYSTDVNEIDTAYEKLLQAIDKL